MTLEIHGDLKMYEIISDLKYETLMSTLLVLFPARHWNFLYGMTLSWAYLRIEAGFPCVLKALYLLSIEPEFGGKDGTPF